MTNGANIPVRWTSPEALKDQKYTHKSDVWSYGIVLWEIWSDAKAPYSGMTNEQVWMEVANGYRLEKPPKMDSKTYKQVIKMWDRSPSQRPSFAEIVAHIKERRSDEANISDDMKDLLASALGEKVEEHTGLLGLSARHINHVVRKFMKVVKTMTTTDVLSRMKKILKNEQTSYCNWVSRQPHPISMDPDGSPGWGQATVFVSHAWRYSFEMVCGVIEAYSKELSRRANAAHHPGCISVKRRNNKPIYKPYFWFDIFTVNQYEAVSYSQDFWTTTFKEQVRSIGHTLLILHPWNRPIPLARAWCVWEMYCTLDTGAEIHIRQPLKDAEQLERALAESPQKTMKLVSQINAAESDAWKQDDRDMIHIGVKESVGFDALNAMVQKRLIEFMQFNLDTSEKLFFEVGQSLDEKIMHVVPGTFAEKGNAKIFTDKISSEDGALPISEPPEKELMQSTSPSELDDKLLENHASEEDFDDLYDIGSVVAAASSGKTWKSTTIMADGPKS
eukprot:UC4_evm1s1218